MIIKLGPQRRDDTYTLSKSGDTLYINGDSYDFSPIGIGDELPAEAIDNEFIVDTVTRDTNGHVVVTLILPHGPNAPESTRFPSDIVDPPDGTIELPDYGGLNG